MSDKRKEEETREKNKSKTKLIISRASNVRRSQRDKKIIKTKRDNQIKTTKPLIGMDLEALYTEK